MAEAGAPAIADGTRRALFRVLAPGSGGHHYATLREHDEGPARFTLEVRRGLVWSFTESVLVVRGAASEGGGLVLSVAGASGPGESAGRVRGGDLAAFAREALRIAAGRLGVEAGAFEAATHVDLGESGTLGVEAPVRQRSSELVAVLTRDRPAAGAGAPVAETPEETPALQTPRAAGSSAAREPEVTRASEAPPPVPSEAKLAAAPPTGPGSAPESERTSASAPTAPAAGAPAAREEETARSPGLLGRLAGWLRRAARAAFGR